MRKALCALLVAGLLLALPSCGFRLVRQMVESGIMERASGESGTETWTPPEETDVDEWVRPLADALGCETEIWTEIDSFEEVTRRYLAAREMGLREGYTPVIVVPSDTLLDWLEILADEEGDSSPGAILERAETLTAPEVLADYGGGYEDWEEPPGEYGGEPQTEFYGVRDYFSGKPYRQLILAELPTENPWEAAAWIPMGGWNACPMPEEQVAVFRSWYERYGAVPAVVDHDTWELYLPEPVTDMDEARAIAGEQAAFCYDIVAQGVGSTEALAGTLMGSSVWYFWWD